MVRNTGREPGLRTATRTFILPQREGFRAQVRLVSMPVPVPVPVVVVVLENGRTHQRREPRRSHPYIRLVRGEYCRGSRMEFDVDPLSVDLHIASQCENDAIPARGEVSLT